MRPYFFWITYWCYKLSKCRPNKIVVTLFDPINNDYRINDTSRWSMPWVYSEPTVIDKKLVRLEFSLYWNGPQDTMEKLKNVENQFKPIYWDNQYKDISFIDAQWKKWVSKAKVQEFSSEIKADRCRVDFKVLMILWDGTCNDNMCRTEEQENIVEIPQWSLDTRVYNSIVQNWRLRAVKKAWSDTIKKWQYWWVSNVNPATIDDLFDNYTPLYYNSPSPWYIDMEIWLVSIIPQTLVYINVYILSLDWSVRWMSIAIPPWMPWWKYIYYNWKTWDLRLYEEQDYIDYKNWRDNAPYTDIYKNIDQSRFDDMYLKDDSCYLILDDNWYLVNSYIAYEVTWWLIANLTITYKNTRC